MSRAMVRRAAGVGLATGLGLAVSVLVITLSWQALAVIWPVVFVLVIPTGALAVNLALPRRGGAVAAAEVGLIAGGVAAVISALALYASYQYGGIGAYGLAGIMLSPPFRIGPYNWFGPVPWPLPLLVPLGMALSALQAWLYYELFVDPDAGLRGALADWIARRPAALQSKLLVGFLLLVAGIFLVGWVGFAAMEDMHARLHVLALKAEWWGHLRTIQATVQAERALLDELAVRPAPDAQGRLQQLDAQARGEIDHLLNYPPHTAIFVMSPAVVRREAVALRPLVEAIATPYATFSTQLQEAASAYGGGDRARAAAMLSRRMTFVESTQKGATAGQS